MAAATPDTDAGRLERLGWRDDTDAAFAEHAARGLVPARVARVEHRGISTVFAADGAFRADARPRRGADAVDPSDYPAAGDWVAVSPATDERHAIIEAVLPRRTAFVRGAAGAGSGQRTGRQVVAANVDTVFLTNSLDTRVSARRLERYLTVAWESGAQPVVVLTKTDLVDDLAGPVAAVEAIALGVPVLAISAVTGEGLEALEPYLGVGQTVALLGLSGVGKSTLANRLVGEERMRTKEIRADGRGRHTTSHRELLPLSGGAVLIDTPGMRELLLWDADRGLERTFADVEELAAACRFRDCAHEGEPGCAVIAAIRGGTLAADRLASYKKLQRELRWVETRHDQRVRAEERRRWKVISKAYRARTRGLD
jgi:ribosome biogenesis GTPase / thiamine phosphate phosphatase